MLNLLSGVSLIGWIGIGALIGVAILTVFFVVIGRVKKCPSDKIMVVYGKVVKNKDGSRKSALCLHGGVKFIVPFFQSYTFLSLKPISIKVDLRSALSKQNIRIDVPSNFTVAISTESGVMQNAAERLLGLNDTSIEELAKDIILGQLRLIIATMEIEEINADRDKFLESVSKNVEIELKKIGLRLINVNVTDIKDDSGYIEALGKEAAAKVINEAKKNVAEKNRDGSIGEANALRDQRIEVAVANSKAIEGENESLGKIAQSGSIRREVQAEAERKAKAAELIADAKAKEEAYRAQELAEKARSEKEKATLEADVIVNANIEKEKMIIDAEAKAEQIRREAKGQADAEYARYEAQARGTYEILSKQALGFSKLVESAGGSEQAIQMLITDKLERLVSIQVEAIKNLKFDKITVWDSGTGANGGSNTSNFASSLLKSIPPLQDLYKSAGLKLPDYLAKEEETPNKEDKKSK
jgi:flotillin